MPNNDKKENNMKKTLPRKDGKDFTGEKLHYLQASPDGSCAPNTLAIIFTYYLIGGRYRNQNIMLDELICVWNLWYQGTNLVICEEQDTFSKHIRFESLIKKNISSSKDSERLITPVLRLYAQIWWLEIKSLSIQLKELIQAGASAQQVLQHTECREHIVLAKLAINEYYDESLPGAPRSETSYPYPTPAGWFTLDAMTDVAQLLKMDIAIGLNANFSKESVVGTYQSNDDFIKELKTWLHHSQECEIYTVDRYIRDLKDGFRRTFWQLEHSFSSCGNIETGHGTLLAAVVNRAGQHFDPALPDYRYWEIYERDREAVKQFLDQSPRVDLATSTEHRAIQQALKASLQENMIHQASKKDHKEAERLEHKPDVASFSRTKIGQHRFNPKTEHIDGYDTKRVSEYCAAITLWGAQGCQAVLTSIDPNLRIIMMVALMSLCYGICVAKAFSWPIAIMGASALAMEMMASFPEQHSKQGAWIAEKSVPLRTAISKAGDYLVRCLPLAALLVGMAHAPFVTAVNLLISAMKKCLWKQSPSTNRVPKQSIPLRAETLVQYVQKYAWTQTTQHRQSERISGNKVKHDIRR